MIERILIIAIGFILGALFVRIWDGLITKRRLENCLEDIAKNRPRLPFPPF